MRGVWPADAAACQKYFSFMQMELVELGCFLQKEVAGNCGIYFQMQMSQTVGFKLTVGVQTHRLETQRLEIHRR